jgi:thiol-disulfide isomerase/thioredoxin
MGASSINRAGVLGLTIVWLLGSGMRAAGAADDKPASPRERLEALKRESDQIYGRMDARRAQAKDDAAKKAAVDQYWKDKQALAKQAFALADEHPGDTAALDAVVWVIDNLPAGVFPGNLERANQAFDLLAKWWITVVAEFGDVRMPHPYNQTALGDQAQGELFRLRNLSIGKPAPEIEGEDMDGRKLRLSDYRGKVVALVFWATWCGPCMGMVPHERELAKRLEGKPFVLLGVNADDDRAAAKSVMHREQMTWRSWWNGGKTGSIVQKWSVLKWPTVYILDTKGVIRYENVRFETMDQAIDQLVTEAEAGGR